MNASHNWYLQNPAIDIIVSNGPEQAADLDEKQQENLGRNLLQAGEGSAASADEFLEKLSQDKISWPFPVISGIAMESFTNENNQIRFKKRHWERVLSIIDHLPQELQGRLIHQISESVDAGAPKYLGGRDNFRNVIDSLNAYSWATPLLESLEAKSAEIFTEEEEVWPLKS